MESILYNKTKKNVNRMVYEWIMACGENGHIYPNDVYVDLGLYEVTTRTRIVELYCTNDNNVIVISRVDGCDEYDDSDYLMDFSINEICLIADACGYVE